MSKARTIVSVISLGLIISVFTTTIIFWLAGSGSKLASGETADLLIAVGRLSGLLLTLLVFAQLLLASRLPLQDWFKSFNALRIHRFLGFFILGVLTTHVGLLVYGYSLREEVGLLQQASTFITSWDDIITALIAAIVIMIIGIISMRKIRSLLTYEVWYALHLFLYGAILFAISHQISTGDMSSGAAKTFWITLTITVFTVFFIFRVARPALFFFGHKFRVALVVPESKTSASIYIKGECMEKFRFEPGQYAHFTFLQKGLSTHHPFSFSQPYNGSQIRITVKQLGDFTSQIQNLNVGTRVIIDGPMGHLTLSLAQTKKYCFIAGGVGITPLAALARSLTEPEKSVMLVANKSSDDAPLLSEIEATGIKLHRYFSNENPPQRIDASEIQRVCPDVTQRDVYLCGPEAMVQNILKGLRAIGVPEAQLHSEAFSY